MNILTLIPYILISSSVAFGFLNIIISVRLHTRSTVLVVLILLLFAGFLISVLLDIIIYAIKRRPPDIWKLGWLGLIGMVGMIGIIMSPLYVFYVFFAFFAFFGLKKIR